MSALNPYLTNLHPNVFIIALHKLGDLFVFFAYVNSFSHDLKLERRKLTYSKKDTF
jgi:hypothetical protein